MINKNDDIINALELGIRKGKKAKRKQKIINSNIIAFMLFFITFSVSVNVSATFADSLIDLPVLGKIVDFIRIGSGFEEVAQRGYYVKGERIIKDENHEVSIENYYFSDHDLDIVIRLDGKNIEDKDYLLDDVDIMNSDGNEISGFALGYRHFYEVDGHWITNIRITKKEGILPDEVILSLNIEESVSKNDIAIHDLRLETNSENKNNTNFLYEQLEVKLEKQVKEKNKIIEINQNIEALGIEFEIKELVITPTTMNLSIDVHSDSMTFYDFESIYFESEDKTYERISSGVTRSGDIESGYIYYFESSYFDDKAMKLVLEGIFALPNNQSTIVIDLKNQEMLKKIDQRLKLKKVVEYENRYDVYILGVYEEDIGFSKYNGNSFSSMAIMDLEEENETEYVLELDKSLLTESIITIDFWAYPNLLEFNEIVDDIN